MCRHTEDPVIFPDGSFVLASGWHLRAAEDTPPDFGLYLDQQWQPSWPAHVLEWPDFGVPSSQSAADAAILEVRRRARAGERVEVACIGGHGRTGTVLACLAILAGVPVGEAVQWVRQTYCERAVQEPAQHYWVEQFARRHGRGLT